MSGPQNGQMVLSLCDEFYDRVFRFVRQSTDSATAEDITQEVFVRLLQIEGIEQRTINVSYLLKIADNLLKRRYQRRMRGVEILESIQRERSSAAPAPESSPAAASTSREQINLDDLLDRLSENEKNAIELTVCYGLSHREAACSLGVKMTTITNWKFRGLRKLESALRDRDSDAAFRIAG